MDIVLAVRRGNSLAVTFRCKSGDPPAAFDLAGSTLIWRAVWPGGALRKETPADLAMPAPASGEVALALTAAETRALPVGRIARFELERRIGTEQRTLLAGVLDVAEGLNDD